jgi:hypothetical protein
MRDNYTKREILIFINNLHLTNQFPNGALVLNDHQIEVAYGYSYDYYEEDEKGKMVF